MINKEMILMNKINNMIKMGNIKTQIKLITILFSAIFFSILTISQFYTTAVDVSLILFSTLVLIIVYLFILKGVIKYYDFLLIFLVQKFTKRRMRYRRTQVTHLIWLPSSLVSGIGSIVLLIISLYYIKLEVAILGNLQSFLDPVIKLNSTFLPIIIFIFILLGFLSELIYLIKLEKIRVIHAFLASSITIIVFGVLIKVIMTIINSIIYLIG